MTLLSFPRDCAFFGHVDRVVVVERRSQRRGVLTFASIRELQDWLSQTSLFFQISFQLPYLGRGAKGEKADAAGEFTRRFSPGSGSTSSLPRSCGVICLTLA
jgi:hypothetical protein